MPYLKMFRSQSYLLLQVHGVHVSLCVLTVLYMSIGASIHVCLYVCVCCVCVCMCVCVCVLCMCVQSTQLMRSYLGKQVLTNHNRSPHHHLQGIFLYHISTYAVCRYPSLVDIDMRITATDFALCVFVCM